MRWLQWVSLHFSSFFLFFHSLPVEVTDDVIVVSHDDFVSRWKMSNFPRETAIMDSLQLPAERSKKGGQQGRSRPKQAKSKRVNNNRTLV
jgi:hypothetical protein